jgi:plasmid stabilization system protein ParE
MAGSLISPEALQDLQSIQEFVALDNPHAAEKIIDQLFAAFENLAKFPHIGHRRPDLTNRNVRFWGNRRLSCCVQNCARRTANRSHPPRGARRSQSSRKQITSVPNRASWILRSTEQQIPRNEQEEHYRDDPVHGEKRSVKTREIIR